jgi:hypothetical protein
MPECGVLPSWSLLAAEGPGLLLHCMPAVQRTGLPQILSRSLRRHMVVQPRPHGRCHSYRICGRCLPEATYERRAAKPTKEALLRVHHYCAAPAHVPAATKRRTRIASTLRSQYSAASFPALAPGVLHPPDRFPDLVLPQPAPWLDVNTRNPALYRSRAGFAGLAARVLAALRAAPP